MGPLHQNLSLAAYLLMASAAAPAAAETPEEAKAQAELTAAQLANLKAAQEIIASNKATAEGKATLEAIEAGAEGLQLRHVVEDELANRLATAVGDGNNESLILVFGNAPPTTAHYLGMEHASKELALNLVDATEMAKKVFAKRKPSGQVREFFAAGGAFGAANLGLTAISTLVSLLRVDTEMKGVALATDAEFLGPMLAQRLAAKGWQVRPPSNIARSTEYANAIVQQLRPLRNGAAEQYAIYLDRLAAKEGKPENLTEAERIAGKALETVMADYATLVDGLYKPAEGILPATVLEEERQLASAPATQRILYVRKHDAALTSITKKGFLTGLGGSVPAFVSAASSASYSLVGGTAQQSGSVSYRTPVLRVSDVAKWVELREEKPVVGTAAGGELAARE